MFFILCSNSTTVIILDVNDYKILHIFPLTKAKYKITIPIAFSYDSKYLAITSQNTNIILYDTSTFLEFISIAYDSIATSYSIISAMCFSPNGKYLVYRILPEIIILDIHHNYNIIYKITNESYSSILRFSKDSKFLASATNTTIKIWNCNTLFTKVFTEQVEYPTSLCFYNNSNFLAIGYSNKTIDCDNNFTEISELRGHISSITSIDCSPSVETLW